MFENSLKKAKDRNAEERHWEIDDLTVLFEREQLSNEDQSYIVNELIKLLPDEQDKLVVQSIFNLLAEAFYNKICLDLIEETCVKMLNTLDRNSLEYAFEIISLSRLPDKETLIEPYLNSKDPLVKSEAQAAYLSIKKGLRLI